MKIAMIIESLEVYREHWKTWLRIENTSSAERALARMKIDLIDEILKEVKDGSIPS